MVDLFAGRLMSSPPLTTTSDVSVADAATKMGEHRIGSLVVVDDEGDLVGIITTTDFVRMAADGRDTDDATVGEYMSTAVKTTTANTDIREVADTMVEHGIHHVPVVEGDEVIGMVTTTDLTAYLSHVQTPSPS